MSRSIVDRIITLMFTTGRRLRQETARESRSDLSLLQILSLHYIAEHRKLPMKDLAEFLSVTPSTATTLVATLVEHRLVRRQLIREDRRTVLLALTPKGRQTLEKNFAAKKRALRLVLKRLSEEEQIRLVNLLEKISTPSNYEKISK